MSRISNDLFRGFAAQGDDFDAQARSRRANRRRFIVFVGVFVAAALIGLVWVFSRPAMYESTARLSFVPVAGVVQKVEETSATVTSASAPASIAAASTTTYSIRDEVQYLTSRKLLAKVWDDLKGLPSTPAALQTADPPATLQKMLAVTQVQGTNIVSIEASGREPAFLAAFVERVIADYVASLDERFRNSSTADLAETRNEERMLAASLADKRAKLDAFRAKYNIVSLDRDENQVMSEVKGTATSLNLANEKVVAAEGRLNALKEAQAQGKSVIRARDNPTLASLEQQAAAIRTDLRASARQFTEQYLEMDPRIRTQRARLAEIDEQIALVRKDSQSGALQEAQEEVAATRGAVAALRQQLASNQSGVQNFSARLNEYRALEQEAAHLALQHQMADDRADGLEAGERARKPRVEVVEPPSIPQSPSSPAYTRDAALALFAALFLGLATMGIVELFNRPPQQASTVVVPQTWAPIGMAHPDATALPAAGYGALADGGAPASALPAPLPRELTEAELEALMGAADPELRASIALLLMGLTQDEVVNLRRGDVARDTGVVTVSGHDPRAVTIPAPVVALLPVESTPADAPLLTTAGGRPLSQTDVRSALLYAAHDAGIESADEVTQETLRHTYIAFLVRQGARFSDLARIVGSLPADRLSAYRRLAPTGARGGEIDRVLPALRSLDA